MKKIFMLACACLLIAACNSNKKSTDNTTIAADTEVTDMHNAKTGIGLRWNLTPEHSLLQIARVSTHPYAEQG